MKGLRNHYKGWLLSETELRYTDSELKKLSAQDVAEQLKDIAHQKYDAKEERVGEEIMRKLERLVMLRIVDEKWMGHIDDMDQLRKSIHLRSYAQKDPVVEYRFEGYNMFDEMIASIREDTAKMMMTAELVVAQKQAEAPAQQARAVGGDDSASKSGKVQKKNKIGRNEPCPCGSGKKYKQCCGRNTN